jgi:hypothetical protein
MASSPFAINSNRQRYPPTLSLFDLNAPMASFFGSLGRAS